MGADQKLLEKIRSKSTPIDIRLSELRRILRNYGFSEVDGKGSHINFKHQKLPYLITIANHGEGKCVSPSSIKKIKLALNEIEGN